MTRSIFPPLLLLVALTTIIGCTAGTQTVPVKSPESPMTEESPEVGSIAPELSATLSAMIRHSEMNANRCWTHEARLAAIPDSLELAAQYDPDVPDELPGVDPSSRPDMNSIARSGFRGIIVVDVLVDTYGQAAMVCIVEGAGPDIDRLVAESVFRTKYVSGRKGGVAVPVWMRTPYRFTR